MFDCIILLDDNVDAIHWQYDNINVIIWLDDGSLLFDQSYDWAGIILDVIIWLEDKINTII
jgi:hypothetical protein